MKKNDKSKGFTLIEVIIAISVISIIVLFFYNILNHTIRMNEKTEKDIQMMDVAQSEIENILASIREGSKNDEDIKVKIGDMEVELDSLFEQGDIYSTEYDKKYKDGITGFTINMRMEREKISNINVLSNCYLYSINYKVKEIEDIDSYRSVSLSTSILSMNRQ